MGGAFWFLVPGHSSLVKARIGDWIDNVMT